MCAGGGAVGVQSLISRWHAILFPHNGEPASLCRFVIKMGAQYCFVWLRWTLYLGYQHFRYQTKIGKLCNAFREGLNTRRVSPYNKSERRGWLHKVIKRAFAVITCCLRILACFKLGRVRHLAGTPINRIYVPEICSSGIVQVWNIRSQQTVINIHQDSDVLSATFSPDGRYVIFGDYGGTMHVWHYRPEDLIAEACSRITRSLTPEEWRNISVMLFSIGQCVPISQRKQNDKERGNTVS